MSIPCQLFIVSTPIGHLSDITLRAIEVLKSVDKIAAEDTRHSQRLLSHYQITTTCFSLHEHNEEARINNVINWLQEGLSIALISDAGTPLISDPGFKLVRAVREAGFKVTPVPGACAAIAALSASGLPTDRFIFEGFLPAKKAALISHLETLQSETRTLIFYESVHRIVKTLAAFCEVFGEDRQVTVARELTKTYETICQDTLKNMMEWVTKNSEQQKGEFVIILAGADKKIVSPNDAECERILTILLQEMSVKQAVKIGCELTGARKKVIYDMALNLKNKIGIDSEDA